MQSTHEWDATEAALADLGELAGPLTHEVNTLLHNLSLHLALLQKAPAEASEDDLHAIRQQITQMAGVVSRFQRRPWRDGSDPMPVDVNAALVEAALSLQEFSALHGTSPIEILQKTGASPAQADAVVLLLRPAMDLPWVLAFQGDVRRLWRFLLTNALRVVAPGDPPVVARTCHGGNDVHLMVEDSGPDVLARDLPRIFDAGASRDDGLGSLELAACQTIVKRLRGSVRAEHRQGGGLIVDVALPAVAHRPQIQKC